MTLTENGKRRRMPKRQALAKQVINKALSNDPKAAALVLDQIRRSEGSADGPAMIDVEQRENRLVIESIVRRIRMNAVELPTNVGPDDDQRGIEMTDRTPPRPADRFRRGTVLDPPAGSNKLHRA